MPRTKGPALLYVTSDGRTVPVDREAVTDPRERALYRGLTARADQLADAADNPDTRRPIGFPLATDTDTAED